MEYKIRDAANGQVKVISTPVRFNIEVSEEFRIILKEFVDQKQYKIVVDLSETEYMDSSGLGAIVSRISAVRSHEGDIRLAAPKEFVKNLLDVTNLVEILKIYDDVSAAIDSY